MKKDTSENFVFKLKIKLNSTRKWKKVLENIIIRQYNILQ